jgi:glycosyltransferase involved in cell wall biosynthesis
VTPPFFTIVVVSLNSGDGLRRTLRSIKEQTFSDYEILIKDGGSGDGSTDSIEESSTIRFVQCPDRGIFDAMNQAVIQSSGRYLNFLNCGDMFFDKAVLGKVAGAIRFTPEARIFYGDVHKPRSRSGYVIYPRRMSRYFLYTHPVCQQAWFVARDLLMQYPFETASAIGGDDIWFKRIVAGMGERACKIRTVVVTYQGGGISENPDRQAESHPFREMARREVFSKSERILYGFLFRLRTFLKSFFYDPFLWRLVRAYRKWQQAS